MSALRITGLLLALATAADTKPRGTPLPEGALARVGSLMLRCQTEYVDIEGRIPISQQLAFLPDGRHLTLMDWSFHLHVWDAATGQEVRWLTREADCAALSPDGHTVASGEDTSVVFSDTRTGKVRKRLPLRTPLRCLAFSGEGKLLAGGDTAVHIWDARTGKEQRLLEMPRRDRNATLPRLSALVFSPNGALLAGVAHQDIHIWDLAQGKRVRVYQGHSQPVAALVFSPDGKRLATAGFQGAVCLWDDSSLDEVWWHLEETVGGLAFSPDGKRLATAGHKGICLWDVGTGKEKRRFPGSVRSVAFAPDGKTLAAARTDGRVQLWDLTTRKIRLSGVPFAAIEAAAFGERGRLLNLGTRDGTVLQAQAATGKILRRFPGPPKGTFGQVAFAPDYKTLAAVAEPEEVPRLWDVVRGKVLHNLPVQRPWGPMGFTPDGRLLAVASAEGLSLWDVNTGQKYCCLEDSGDCHGFTFSPDGRAVAATRWKDGISVWETATGKRRRRWCPQPPVLSCQTFTADGRRLAASSWRDLWLFDVASGRSLAGTLSHPGLLISTETVLAVALSPDGRLLASGKSADHFVYLWDVATGKRLRRLSGHLDCVRALAFSPDGKRLVSGGDDGLAFVWDMKALLSAKKPITHRGHSTRGTAAE